MDHPIWQLLCLIWSFYFVALLAMGLMMSPGHALLMTLEVNGGFDYDSDENPESCRGGISGILVSGSIISWGGGTAWCHLWSGVTNLSSCTYICPSATITVTLKKAIHTSTSGSSGLSGGVMTTNSLMGLPSMVMWSGLGVPNVEQELHT